MSRKQPSRRDFLNLAGQAPGDVPAPQSPQPAVTLQLSRRAMACEFEVCLPAQPDSQVDNLALAALDLVDQLEEQLSFFRPGSDISRINLLAPLQAVQVEQDLCDLLALALDVWRDTGGAFDLTATPLWEVWGFSRRSGAAPSAEELNEALSRVGSQWIELDRERRTIRFTKPGVRLNLGAIGKGYALDRCDQLLAEAKLADYLLSAGGSSIIARGGRGLSQFSRGLSQFSYSKMGLSPSVDQEGLSPSAGWIIGITNPLRPDRRLGELRLVNRALATSGSWVQSFRVKGKRYGHILDPRTGWPAADVLSTTVLAPTAALADALSTAFYVLGLERTIDFCRARPELAALLAVPAKTSGGLAIHRINLSDDDLLLY